MNAMNAPTRYDMLEVVLHTGGSDPASVLACLQDSVEPRFEVASLEDAGSARCDRHRTLRIACAMGEAFDSAASFDAELRDLTGDAFRWTRVGAIRMGQAATV